MGCGQGGGESGRVGDATREPTKSNVGSRIDVGKGYVAGLKILGDGWLAWQLQKFCDAYIEQVGLAVDQAVGLVRIGCNQAAVWIKNVAKGQVYLPQGYYQPRAQRKVEVVDGQ
jgi:hypothetical protein